MNTARISDVLYHGNTADLIRFVEECKSEEDLYVFMYNYNWENGLTVPRLVMESPACSLQIALLIFHAGDGFTFLSEGMYNQESTDEWNLFMQHLYNAIIANQYPMGQTSFMVPLTKVQLFKLKKQINPEALVLLTDFPGVNCNITI